MTANYLIILQMSTQPSWLGSTHPAGAQERLPEDGLSSNGNLPVDVVFIIDESGSMSADQQAVLANVDFIASQLVAFVDPRYALVGFGASGSHGNIDTHTDFTDAAGLSAALGTMVAGGSHEPGVEATIYAMNNLAGYRPGVESCVVLITDEDSDGGALSTANVALDGRNAVWLGIVNLGTV